VAGKIKGITITLGADVQPLKKALEDVNKKSRDLQGELRQVERLLKLDPKNTDLLAQRQKLLAEAVENSREKLDRLKTAQEQVNEQFRKGEINEEQYRAFQREVVKAEQELEKFEKQLRETGLTAEKVGQKLKDAGQKMTDIGKDLSLKVTAPIVAAGGAAFKMAADLQDALGATEQIFKSAADSVKQWADNLDSYYGIAEGEALEYANMMGTLLMNIGGLTEEEAARQAQILVQLAGDLTAMFGGETSSAIQALTGALKGNTAMLDNYGIACNDALIKTKALEMGIWDGKGQMELAAKQAAILALIMEQTGAAQGQAAREAEGASGGTRAFATEIKNLATDIGEVLLPVITPLLNSLGEIVKKFSELSPETQKTIVIIAGLAAAIGPLLMILGPIVSTIGSLVVSLGAMSTAMAGGASLVAGLTAGFPALGAAITLITGPIGIAIAAIAGLVAAGVLIYKNWDEIKEKAIEIWTKIQDFFSETSDKIKETFTNVMNSIKDFFKKWGDEIILIAVGPAGWAVLLGRKIAENWDSIKAKTSEIWNSVKDWLSNTWNNIKQTASNVWSGIKSAILNPIESAKRTIMGIIDTIRNAFANMRIEIPRPKLPKISVDWRSVGVGNAKVSIPDFNINWYKMGGIFNRPSIIGVGEAGTEAVIPLDKMPGLIADALRDAMGGNQLAMAGGITVQNMYVRNDQDIKLIARELYNLQQTNARGRGLR
jgi:phage-related minor tail protein